MMLESTRQCRIPGLSFLHAKKVRASKIIPMLHAIPGINELFREDLDNVFIVAPTQTAPEFKVKHFGIVVLEHHILHVDAFEFLLMLRPLLDVPVEFTVFGDGMTPKLPTAPRLLTYLQLDAFFLFVLGQLHDVASSEKNETVLLRRGIYLPLITGNLSKFGHLSIQKERSYCFFSF